MILTVECILLCIALEWTLPVPYPLLASLDKLCMELCLVHQVWVWSHGPMVLMEEIYKMLPHWTTFWSGHIQWGFWLSFCLLLPGWPALLLLLEWWCAAPVLAGLTSFPLWFEALQLLFTSQQGVWKIEWWEGWWFQWQLFSIQTLVQMLPAMGTLATHPHDLCQWWGISWPCFVL